MKQLEAHPTVRKVRTRPEVSPQRPLPEELLELALAAGADDAGLVSIDDPAVSDQRADILRAMPGTRSLLSFCLQMQRESIRSPARSVANVEFHHSVEDVDGVARRVAARLRDRGVRALVPATGFPMEMDRFPGKIWVISHKPVAVAAGLGVMGIHRNVIHPRFGNFILLGTVATDLELEDSDRSTPLDFNPCLECKLCVAACPVGAVQPDGGFDFSACYTHNYREFMGGFGDWAESVAEAGSRLGYRERVSDAESASLWQSLSFGANYKAAYCMAVCPAGEDVIGPFLDDRSGFLQSVVQPLQKKTEPVYVLPGSDAEAHVERRFPHKERRRVTNSLRPASIDGFLSSLGLVFQKRGASDLSARYHLRFRGDSERRATVVIDGGRVLVEDGLQGTADLAVDADAATWLSAVRGERSMVWALLTRRVRLRGPLRLLRRFAACFPS